MSHPRLRWLALSLLLFAGACALPMDLPDGFVKVGGGRLRAVTADDAHLLVRDLHDDAVAPLDFWAQTLQNDFTQQRGYEITGQGEVKDAAGVPGAWFECVTNVEGQRVGYLVALWASESGWLWRSGTDLFVVEFVAGQEVYARHVGAVREALATVRR